MYLFQLPGFPLLWLLNSIVIHGSESLFTFCKYLAKKERKPIEELSGVTTLIYSLTGTNYNCTAEHPWRSSLALPNCSIIHFCNIQSYKCPTGKCWYTSIYLSLLRIFSCLQSKRPLTMVLVSTTCILNNGFYF